MAAVVGGTVLGTASAQALTTFSWSLPTSGTYATLTNGTTPTGTTWKATAWENTYTSVSNGVYATDGKLQKIQMVGYSGGLGANPNNISGGDTFPPTVTVGTKTLYETTDPFHAIDNSYNNYEMILLDFGTEVSVTSLTFNWPTTTPTWVNGVLVDSDVTVAAYTGSLDPNAFLTGKTYADLKLAGSEWTYIKDFADVANATNNTITPNGPANGARYWLVGAYNPVLSGGTSLTTGDDFIKLASVGGFVPPVPPSNDTPAPGVAALFGLGLALMGWQRRQFAA